MCGKDREMAQKVVFNLKPKTHKNSGDFNDPGLGKYVVCAMFI